MHVTLPLYFIVKYAKQCLIGVCMQMKKVYSVKLQNMYLHHFVLTLKYTENAKCYLVTYLNKETFTDIESFVILKPCFSASRKCSHRFDRKTFKRYKNKKVLWRRTCTLSCSCKFKVMSLKGLKLRLHTPEISVMALIYRCYHNLRLFS